jgi:hypothetical protein
MRDRCFCGGHREDSCFSRDKCEGLFRKLEVSKQKQISKSSQLSMRCLRSALVFRMLECREGFNLIWSLWKADAIFLQAASISSKGKHPVSCSPSVCRTCACDTLSASAISASDSFLVQSLWAVNEFLRSSSARFCSLILEGYVSLRFRRTENFAKQRKFQGWLMAQIVDAVQPSDAVPYVVRLQRSLHQVPSINGSHRNLSFDECRSHAQQRTLCHLRSTI